MIVLYNIIISLLIVFLGLSASSIALTLYNYFRPINYTNEYAGEKDADTYLFAAISIFLLAFSGILYGFLKLISL